MENVIIRKAWQRNIKNLCNELKKIKLEKITLALIANPRGQERERDNNADGLLSLLIKSNLIKKCPSASDIKKGKKGI